MTEEEGGAQAGEGQYALPASEEEKGPNARMDTGGTPIFAAFVFASGVGPIMENDAPYMSNEAARGDEAARGEYGYLDGIKDKITMCW